MAYVSRKPSFCTVTDGLRHDAAAIYVHLEVAINHLAAKRPHIEHLHVVSDGLTTQYRSKTMFYLLATKPFVWVFFSVT